MDAREESDSRTKAERKSERELVVTRTFDAPARLVFEAWTKPELFERRWAPKSFGVVFVSCELDVRVGGRYRLVMRHGDSKPMEFRRKRRSTRPSPRTGPAG